MTIYKGVEEVMLVVMFVMFDRQMKVPPSCLFPRRESFILTQGTRYSHAGNNPVPIMGVTLSHNGNKKWKRIFHFRRYNLREFHS